MLYSVLYLDHHSVYVNTGIRANRLSETMVVQTRSKAVGSGMDDSQEQSEVVEEPIGACLEEMFKRTQALEISVAEQNKNMAEVLNIVRMLPKHQASSSGKQIADNTYLVSTAFMGNLDDGSDASLGYRSSQNHPQNYSGITRIGKVDFVHFDGSQI